MIQSSYSLNLIRLFQFEKNLTKEMNKYQAKDRIAENTSSYSALPARINYSTSTAYEAIASFLCLVYQTSERDGYLRMSWTDKMLKQAWYYQNEGKWNVVMLLSKQRNITLHSVWTILKEHFSDHDIHGNIIPLAGKISKTMKISKMYQERRGRVKYPKRKRGYDDKGSLRPAHRWLPTHIFNGPNPERKSLEEILSEGFRPRNASFWLRKFIKRRKDE